MGVGAAEALVQALLAAAALTTALREAGDQPSVLVLADADGPLAMLARALVASGHVVVAADASSEAVRAQLASADPSGRAQVVVAGPDVRAAVRTVRRGGWVCVTTGAELLPSVTELVQREVTLVGPEDVADVVSRIDRVTWSAAVAAA